MTYDIKGKSTELKNGDKIKITIKEDGKLAKAANLHLDKKTFTYEATGQEEPETIDIKTFQAFTYKKWWR